MTGSVPLRGAAVEVNELTCIKLSEMHGAHSVPAPYCHYQ